MRLAAWLVSDLALSKNHDEAATAPKRRSHRLGKARTLLPQTMKGKAYCTFSDFADIRNTEQAFIADVVIPEQDLALIDPNVNDLLPAPIRGNRPNRHVNRQVKQRASSQRHRRTRRTQRRPSYHPQHRIEVPFDGMVEKLKTRIELRRDLMRENVYIPDTWCPIARFKAYVSSSPSSSNASNEYSNLTTSTLSYRPKCWDGGLQYD